MTVRLSLLFLMIVVYSPKVWSSNYSKQPKIVKLISSLEKNVRKCLLQRNRRFCKKGKKDAYKGTGWCYRYVKVSLLRAGLTSKYIGGGSAHEAGPFLEEEGFVNLLKNPKLPIVVPVGSILVYKTNRKHGHIEIRTGENRFVSDHARDEMRGRLIGVYIKKALVSQEVQDVSILHPPSGGMCSNNSSRSIPCRVQRDIRNDSRCNCCNLFNWSRSNWQRSAYNCRRLARDSPPW